MCKGSKKTKGLNGTLSKTSAPHNAGDAISVVKAMGIVITCSLKLRKDAQALPNMHHTFFIAYDMRKTCFNINKNFMCVIAIALAFLSSSNALAQLYSTGSLSDGTAYLKGTYNAPLADELSGALRDIKNSLSEHTAAEIESKLLEGSLNIFVKHGLLSIPKDDLPTLIKSLSSAINQRLENKLGSVGELGFDIVASAAVDVIADWAQQQILDFERKISARCC